MNEDGGRERIRRSTSAHPAQKPTLRTISQMTGLAVTTVSRALGGAPQIALETRERVQRVAADIGYLPDRAAQRLRTGRTNVITLVLDPHDEILGFGTSLIRGVTRALRDTQYHLVVSPHFADVPGIDVISHIVRNRMADGVVFSRTQPLDDRVKYLIEHDFPFICHGRTDLAAAHPFVDYDNAAFARAAALRLAEKGRRKLMILLPPARFTFFQHLRHGFLSIVREHGLDWEIPEDITLDSPSRDIYRWIGKRLESPNAPDGYICPGEVSALAFMAALTDHGLTIGDDVDLVGKQTSDLFGQIRPRVDAIYEDLDGAGEKMGALLLCRIAGHASKSLQFLQDPKPVFLAKR